MSDCSDLIAVIQGLSAATNEAGKPTVVMEGEVTETDPLMITLSEKLILRRSNIVFAKGLSLEIGDKVLMIRSQGGQKYYVICEVER